MATKLNPYIHFNGNARQAIEFYHSVFGGNLSMNTFEEFNASQDPGDANKLMHAQLDTGNGLTLMAADTPSGMDYTPGTSITISLSGEDENELSGYFNKLSQGGQVAVPLEKSPWGDTFGMLTDQFGVEWMVNISGARG